MYYDDFLKSIAFGRKEFETEEDLIDCFEEYIKSQYEWEVNNQFSEPTNVRYIYRACEEGFILYYEKMYDAMRCVDRELRTDFISVDKNSQEYRIANTNSTRHGIECYLKFVDLKFMIGGELKPIEYFSEAIGFRDNMWE